MHASFAKLQDAFQQATCRGLMSENQYRLVAERVLAVPGSLLVFGLGHDAGLWRRCARNDVAFVEDDLRYKFFAPRGVRVVHYPYPSRLDVWSRVPPPPPLIDQPWDYVLVDGPRGYDRSCPGRQFPVTWARQLARRLVFVHDYERPWEREVCTTILGAPIDRLKPTGGRRGELAVFDVKAIPSHPNYEN